VPWKVEARDGKFCVVKESDGSTVHCFDSKDQATAQLRALYASEAKAFRVVKQANGVYRWYGMPSNNARDRDKEFIGKVALELDVHRTKTYGDDSELWLHHIPVRLGSAPDFRAVVDGVLVESGEFDDTPVAKAVASYIERTPDGPDGSGWGMSIGFYGLTEDGQTFNTIRIRERSVLSAAMAANPYTRFEVQEVRKMALNASQRTLLETIAADTEAREAARLILAAADQSKALDTAGIERKAAETPITPAPDPTPAAEPVVEEKAVPADEKPADGKKCPKCGKPMHDGACKPADMPAGKALDGTRPLTWDDLPDLHAFITATVAAVSKAVKAEQDAVIAEVNKNFTALTDAVTTLHGKVATVEAEEKAIQEQHVTPRTTLEFLKSLSATGAEATVVDKTDPLAQAAPGDTQTEFFKR
jgi:hypothetical protein